MFCMDKLYVALRCIQKCSFHKEDLHRHEEIIVDSWICFVGKCSGLLYGYVLEEFLASLIFHPVWHSCQNWPGPAGLTGN